MKRSLIVAAAGALLLTGCSPLTEVISRQSHTVPACGRSDGVVLVVGAHRDAPTRSSLTPRVACLVAGAIKAGKPVILVDASGQPRVVTPRLLAVNGGTLAQQDAPRVAEDLQRVKDAVADLRPESPGVDDLAALSEVVSQLKAGGNDPKLHGFTVLLVGIGYTSPPQAPLAAKWRSTLTQIWHAVVTSAGAAA